MSNQPVYVVVGFRLNSLCAADPSGCERICSVFKTAEAAVSVASAWTSATPGYIFTVFPRIIQD